MIKQLNSRLPDVGGDIKQFLFLQNSALFSLINIYYTSEDALVLVVVLPKVTEMCFLK